MAKSDHPQAQACAKAIFMDKYDNHWTTGSNEFAESMNFVASQWEAFEIVQAMIKHCDECEYQSLLADAMGHFGWEERLDDMIKLIEGRGNSRDAVALVCSLLAPSTPRACAQKLLQVSLLSPPQSSNDCVHPSAGNLAHLFTHAYQNKIQIIRKWAETGEKELFIDVVVPAFIDFASSIPADRITDELRGLKTAVLKKLERQTAHQSSRQGKKSKKSRDTKRAGDSDQVKALRDLGGTVEPDHKRQKTNGP